ncbi:MAG: FAD-dependent oxidoreductase [Deltaproteobacteria bacterium]|nr:FAD-dependent oxidoreductase [Deltaproteobacteria bacterium]
MAGIKKVWTSKKPKRTYDVVVIGGGLHGMSTAYYLAKDRGIKNVAVLERRYVGFGGSGRNTEVYRINQRAPEIIPLYELAVDLWNGLSQDVDFNIMNWNKGLIGLAHSEATLSTMLMRHETQTRMGVENHLLTPPELKKLLPGLDISTHAALPIMGGYFHPPAGTIRHDASVWAYAKGCEQMGIDICEGVEVTGINIENGKVTGVETSEGSISAPAIHCAVGGYSSTVAAMAGVMLPVETTIMQAMVSEAIENYWDHVWVSEGYGVFGQQSLKGDLVMGAHLDPWQTYTTDNNAGFLEHCMYNILQLFPDLANVRLMRTWSGLCDMTVDSAPVMGDTPVQGFYVDAGWGYFGFKSAPACGKVMAEYIASGNRPELIKYLGIERFYTGDLVPETYLARS